MNATKTYVNQNHPEKDLVLAIMKPEEFKHIKQLTLQMQAIEKASDVPYQFALDVERAYYEAWDNLCKTYNLEPSWNMHFCMFTGYIISKGN